MRGTFRAFAADPEFQRRSARQKAVDPKWFNQVTPQLTSNKDHHQVKASSRSTMETMNTSTPINKPPSRHREFFEKLYGSLDRNEAKSDKLDTSTSSDESLEKKDLTSDLSDHGTDKNEEKSPPIRPFPSFPIASSMEQNRLMSAANSASQNLPYFPPSALHHMTSGPSMEAAAAAGLRLPDFPFPGGLAAFCK